MNREHSQMQALSVTEVPDRCRCGGAPSEPEPVAGCQNRWTIRCQVKHCCAINTGEGLNETIIGWNRLSSHFYR